MTTERLLDVPDRDFSFHEFGRRSDCDNLFTSRVSLIGVRLVA
jgi:hypothetical protein